MEENSLINGISECKTYDQLIKLLLLGDSGVGKSSLLIRFVDNVFTTSYMSTIGIDFKIKTINVQDKKIKLQIWDTAGQEKYNTITRAFYRGAMGIILVYDVTNVLSFRNITKWLNQLDIHGNDNIEKVLVGNKIDLSERRAVHFDLGQSLADEKQIHFVEVSAQSGEGVNALYEDLTLRILNSSYNKSKATTLKERQSVRHKLRPKSIQKKKSKCCKK